MKTIRTRRHLNFLLFLFALAALPLLGQNKERLTLQTLLERHLAVVGSGALDRKTANVQGRARLQILVGGRASLQGPFYLQSRSKQLSYLLHFNVSHYEHERFLADPEGAEVGYMRPGERSPLGEFLHVQKQILREGFWGGVLSTAFPLFDLTHRQPRLKYAGLKKEEGRRLHRIDYSLKRPQGELKIRLFFDPESFDHVRTTYDLTLPAPLGSNTVASARQKATRHELSEDFADFQAVSGLRLPHRWIIRYRLDATDATLAWEWSHEVLAQQFDQTLDEAVFKGVAAGSK